MASDLDTPILARVEPMDISHHHRMKTTDVRNKFGWIIDTVAVQKSVVILHRRGRNLAAIIPMEEFLVWEKLVQKEEDRQDIEEAERVLAEDQESIPLEQLIEELRVGSVSGHRKRTAGKSPAAAAKRRAPTRSKQIAETRGKSKDRRSRSTAGNERAVARSGR